MVALKGSTKMVAQTRRGVSNTSATEIRSQKVSLNKVLSHQSEQLTELRNLSACISIIFVILCGTSEALFIYSHSKSENRSGIFVSTIVAMCLEKRIVFTVSPPIAIGGRGEIVNKVQNSYRINCSILSL